MIPDTVSKKNLSAVLGYKDDEKVRPLCIMLEKINEHVKSLYIAKYMYFLIEDEK